ncbi:MAG: glycoside hydrolase family 3 N-terminal domain-containing protein [Gemmatimonadales bacterium]|nr:glycoside hydrolase family 3 N-terminal domain-containing protein [Gemmatimonadales bacterium]
MKPARLVMPALRWRAESGFGHEQAAIDAAIAAGVGGFIVFGGTPEDVLELTSRIRHAAGRPLLIGADLERGPGQQVTGLAELPPPLALASLDDGAAARAAGRITGEGARSVGINWAFAPVCDLDIEANNPIVQTRSFGAKPEAVARQVAEWIGGAREAGVLTAAKHFPGHGRTRHDSHDRMPVVDAPLDRLEREDLTPFRAAIAAGVDAVMTAHVAYPALDATLTPATRSVPILHRLRTAPPAGLDFGGLVVSDALIMEGFAGGLGPVAGAVAAVAAGVDVLLYPPDPIAVVAGLEQALASDPGFEARVGQALARQAAALDRLARGEPARAEADRSGAAIEAAALAARLVTRGAPTVTLRAPLELEVVDDDLDGAWPASPNDFVERSLRAAGVPLGPGGTRIVLAYAEPRASKGRAGFGPRCRAALAAGRPDLVVLFAHPRLEAELPAGVPVVRAWHRQRLMQEAVAAWMVAGLGK